MESAEEDRRYRGWDGLETVVPFVWLELEGMAIEGEKDRAYTGPE